MSEAGENRKRKERKRKELMAKEKPRRSALEKIKDFFFLFQSLDSNKYFSFKKSFLSLLTSHSFYTKRVRFPRHISIGIVYKAL